MMSSVQTVVSEGTSLDSSFAFDVLAFRQALGCFPTGVAIISTIDSAGNPVGLTCNSFNSVSLAPPLVLWSLRYQSKLLETFRTAGVFAINVLARDQQNLSARFASSAIADKFDCVKHRAGTALGVPLINACVASFECRTLAEHQIGDHVLFIGEVERFDGGHDKDALVFHRGTYKALSRLCVQ